MSNRPEQAADDAPKGAGQPERGEGPTGEKSLK